MKISLPAVAAAGFIASSLFGALALPVPGNADCYTKINKIGSNYYIQCNNTTCDNGSSCDPQRSQSGSTYYYTCFCDQGPSPVCNGTMKSNSSSSSDPGFDVYCQEFGAGCPDPTPICDEEQLDSDEETFEKLCTCKPQ